MSDSDSIGPHLRAELLATGGLRHLEWFAHTDSTNLAARRWLRKPTSALPALFVADHQSAGRGRSDHAWWSPAGCLMFTLVLEAEALPGDPAQWGQLALTSGVAVAETIERLTGGTPTQLKWPNDVYLRGRKVAGILIESTSRQAGPESPPPVSPSCWLIGVGLNVDIDWSSAPLGLAHRAVCIAQATGHRWPRDVVLAELLGQLTGWISGWKRGDRHWQDGWRERCLLTGKTVGLRGSQAGAGTSEVTGRCEGVDAQGQLLLRTPAGVASFYSGEVMRWQ